MYRAYLSLYLRIHMLSSHRYAQSLAKVNRHGTCHLRTETCALVTHCTCAADAIKAYRKFLLHDPNNAQAYANLGYSLSLSLS